MVHANCPYITRRSFGGGNRVYYCGVGDNSFDLCDTSADNYTECFWHICAEEKKNPRHLVVSSSFEGGEF